MPRILYNEGRVVGYSAYEEYVRQALQQDPDSTPATEKEWLASTISIGSSMLLHIQPDAENSLTRDFKLPETSRLFAANTIIGSFFEGVGHDSADSPWCDYVESYGNLITNTTASHPTTDATTYPSTEDSDEYKQKIDNQIKQYLKIKDGVVIKEGTWTASAKTPPAEVLTSTNNNPPVVRLSFESKIDTDFYILLSGFTDKAVIKGVTNIENQTETLSPQNGDFLGPAVFPWANKIIFTLSSRQDEIIKSNTLGDIKAGIGIEIDKNTDGSITINNSAPNWDSAKYYRATNADLNTDGQYKVLCFNSWKSGVKNLASTITVTGESIGFMNILKDCDDIPIDINTSYNQNGELISFSMKISNALGYDVTTNIDPNTDTELDNPVHIKDVFGRLVNPNIINVMNYKYDGVPSYIKPSGFTNKGIGIKFLHSDTLIPDSVRTGRQSLNDVDTHTNPNNMYYSYQSVVMAIHFKDYGQDTSSNNKKIATDIHRMLLKYTQSRSSFNLSSSFGSNILNLTCCDFIDGKNYYTYGALYDTPTNTYYRNDASKLGSYTYTSEETSNSDYTHAKNFGGSWSVSYGFRVLSQKDIDDAKVEYDGISSNDKTYTFYKQIVCKGTSTEVLQPGDILVVLYSISDGYNTQIYKLSRHLDSEGILAPSTGYSDATRIMATGQNLTATFSLTKV